LLDQIVIEYLQRDRISTGTRVLSLSCEVALIMTLVGLKPSPLSSKVPGQIVIFGFVLALNAFVLLVSLCFRVTGTFKIVLERSRQIGILRAFGASPSFILNLWLQETLAVAVSGSILGILFLLPIQLVVTHGLHYFLILKVRLIWWPVAGAIAAAFDLFGAAVATRRAFRIDVLDLLATED